MPDLLRNLLRPWANRREQPAATDAPLRNREFALATLRNPEASYQEKIKAIHYLGGQCELDREIALAFLHAPAASSRKIDAIEYLSKQSGPEIVEGLRAALGNASVIGWELDHVRVAALERLGHLAPELAEPFLTYHDGEVRAAAAAILHRSRPDAFGPPTFTLIAFRTGEPPGDPKSYSESLLRRKVADSALRGWHVVGVRALLSEDATISLYHQMVREQSLQDLGPVSDAWRDSGPDGRDCVLLLFK
jgi:hypothetical protein